MKRLIKKSKFFDGFNFNNKYYEIYKDPSTSQVNEIKKQDELGYIRGLIARNGDVYVWAADVLHDECPLSEYGIHFDFDNSSVTFNLDGEATMENVINSFDIAQTYLSNVGIVYNTPCTVDAVEFNDETYEILAKFKNVKQFYDILYIVNEEIGEEAEE